MEYMVSYHLQKQHTGEMYLDCNHFNHFFRTIRRLLSVYTFKQSVLWMYGT